MECFFFKSALAEGGGALEEDTAYEATKDGANTDEDGMVLISRAFVYECARCFSA